MKSLRSMLIVLSILTLVSLLVSCGTTASDGSPMTMYQGHESWFKMNDEPITGDATQTLGRAVHEGATGFRNVFINRTGEAVALGDADFPYPEGTVVVKESYDGSSGTMGDLTSLTVMVKRDGSYDPENGNWEYINVGANGKVKGQGRIGMCIDCHSLVESLDYVFTAP